MDKARLIFYKDIKGIKIVNIKDDVYLSFYDSVDNVSPPFHVMKCVSFADAVEILNGSLHGENSFNICTIQAVREAKEAENNEV